MWFKLFDSLTPSEIQWMLETGVERRFAPGSVLVAENEPNAGISFLIDGLMHVSVSSLGDRVVAVMQPGDVIGEVSFLDRCLASATVTAAEETTVLTLQQNELREKLSEDDTFASHFYYAIANTLSQRLRQSTNRLGKSALDSPLNYNSPSPCWQQLLPTLEHIRIHLQEVESSSGERRKTASRELKSTYKRLLMSLGDLLSPDAESENIRREIGARVGSELQQHLKNVKTVNRLRSKPRGLVEDYQNVKTLYRCPNESEVDEDTLEHLFDGCLRDQAIAKAMRFRLTAASEVISQAISHQTGTSQDGEATRICGIHSGPADEVLTAYENLADATVLETTLIDIDSNALQFVMERVASRELSKQVRLVHCNLLYRRLKSASIVEHPQQLVYSLGLLNYLSDSAAINLFNAMHEMLAPGGRAMVGSFDPSLSDSAFMQYVLDWSPRYRTPEEVNALLSQSEFNRGSDEIQMAEDGGSFFAICNK